MFICNASNVNRKLSMRGFLISFFVMLVCAVKQARNFQMFEQFRTPKPIQKFTRTDTKSFSVISCEFVVRRSRVLQVVKSETRGLA